MLVGHGVVIGSETVLLQSFCCSSVVAVQLPFKRYEARSGVVHGRQMLADTEMFWKVVESVGEMRV